MLENPAYPIAFFLLSGFVFGLALLFALAGAWAKALGPRQHRKANPFRVNRPEV